MCERHRLADAQVQAQNIRRCQAPCAAVIIDLQAAHVGHDEVRTAAWRRSAVEQFRNIRMREVRENLPFPGKIFARRRARNTVQHLDRSLLREVPIRAIREKHATHTAFAEYRVQRPCAEPVANGHFRAHRAAEQLRHRPGNQCGVRGADVARLGQRQHVFDQFWVLRQQLEVLGALCLRQVADFREQAFDLAQRGIAKHITHGAPSPGVHSEQTAIETQRCLSSPVAN